jgi:predicted RNA-binding Zn ribbon-like protein
MGVRSQVRFDSYHDAPSRLAEDLVNTFNVVRHVEKLPDVPSLARFLDDREFTVIQPLTRDDLESVRALRTRLRGIFQSSSEEDAVGVLNAILRDCRALPLLTRHDEESWHMHVTEPDAPVAEQVGAVGAMGLLTVIGGGGFSRLHVCDGRRCEEVFVDASRNQSRRYCSPAICGNRAHAAARRARERQRR